MLYLKLIQTKIIDRISEMIYSLVLKVPIKYISVSL